MIFVPHVSDDDLEKLAMQTLPDAQIGPLENHLLFCDEYRDRLQAEIEFMAAMREAAVKIRCEGIS